MAQAVFRQSLYAARMSSTASTGIVAGRPIQATVPFGFAGRTDLAKNAQFSLWN